MSLKSFQRNFLRTRRSEANPRRFNEKRPALHLVLLFCLATLAPLTAFSRSSVRLRRPSTFIVTPSATQQPTPAQTPQQPIVGPLPVAAPTPHSRPRTVTARPEAPATTESDAGTPAAEVIDDDEVVRVASNLVLVPASVVDARGRAITDLKVEDFELRVDGQVKRISGLSRSETPIHVALLFDNSASLSAARAFEKQAAMRFFQSVVRPIDRAAIYSVSTVPKLEQPFTSDVTRLVKTIERFSEPEGATALFDTIIQAANYLRPIPGRKVIVIVSDGTDTVSDAGFDDALQRALSVDCQVYVVQTRQIEDPNLHDKVSEARLAKLTEQTGGAVYAPQVLQDLDNAFTQISLDLAQQYVLSYSPDDERKDNYFRFISLRVSTRPNLRVRARRGFYPTASQNEAATPAGSATPNAGGANNPSLQSVIHTGRVAPSPAESSGIAYNERSAISDVELGGSEVERAARRNKVGPAGPDEEETRTSETTRASGIKNLSMPQRAASEAPADSAPVRLMPSAMPDSAPSSTSSSRTVAPAAPPSVATVEATTRPLTTASPDASASTRAAKPKAPLSGGVLNNKAVSLPKPLYPQVARNAGAAGKVIVEVTIDEKGKVIEARISSGHPLLQSSAMNAARLAKFSPALVSGEPAQVKGIIIYTFIWP